MAICSRRRITGDIWLPCTRSAQSRRRFEERNRYPQITQITQIREKYLATKKHKGTKRKIQKQVKNPGCFLCLLCLFMAGSCLCNLRNLWMKSDEDRRHLSNSRPARADFRSAHRSSNPAKMYSRLPVAR